MTHHPSNKLRRFVGAALGVLVLTIGLTAVAAPASADVLPTDESGCPAGGDPASSLPCVTYAVACPKFGFEVRLANGANATLDAVFDIETPTTTATFTVEPGDTLFRQVHIGEDETVVISVSERNSGREFITDEPFTRDCSDPSATVADISCADGAVVSVSNPGGVTGNGGADFVVDVYDGGANAPTRTVTIEDVVGDASTVVEPVVDGPLRIVVTALTPEGPGFEPTAEVVADRTQSVDCAEPTVTLSAACATGLDVTVSAPAGQDETAFTVVVTDGSGDTVLSEAITVPAGGSTTVNLADPVEGETYTASVTETGTSTPILGTITIPVDCEEPTATVELACAGDGVVATVTTGAGQDETLFDITFTTEAGVATLADQTIPAGTSADFGFASPGEGETISVRVTEAGATTELAGDSLVVDCIEPAVLVTDECTETGVDVTVTAPAGQDETLFTVVVTDDDGEVVVDEDVTIPAGSSTTVAIPDADEGATYTVTVTEQGATEAIGTTELTVDCEGLVPSATAAHACATGITVTLTNADPQTETTFSVVITDEDDAVVLDEDVTIDGVGDTTVDLANPTEDDTHHVLVTAGGQTLVDADLNVDCVEVEDTTNRPRPPTQVGGTQTSRPGTSVGSGTLPRTGGVAGPLGTEHLLAVSFGLILAGAGVAGLATDRRRPARALWR